MIFALEQEVMILTAKSPCKTTTTRACDLIFHVFVE
jgi:hypothetical protein